MSKSSKAAAANEPNAGELDVAIAERPGDNPAANASGKDVAKSAPRKAVAEVFHPLNGDSGGEHSRDLQMVMDIPVALSVELGRTRLTIKQLLELAQGSVVELDGLPGEPMDILINGYLVAQGEVVVVDDKFGIRITDIITPSERLQRINR